MSEKAHTAPAGANGPEYNSVAPIETQRSGFDGERRDSGADELSPQAEASERSSSRRVSRETRRGGDKAPAKNKRSSFYVYLAVLFGAAFLMLLLAYFIQQRNNATAQSDLRSSFSASRQELLDEIQRMEEEKAALEEESIQLQDERDVLEKQLDELREQHAELSDDFSDQYKKVEGWQNFWGLEESFLSRDYEACAHIFQALANAGSLNLPDSDSALARMREICDTLVDRDYLAEGDPAVRLFGAPEAAESETSGQ